MLNRVPLRMTFSAVALYYCALQVVAASSVAPDVLRGKDMVSEVDSKLASGTLASGEKLGVFGDYFLRSCYPGVVIGQYLANQIK